MTELDGSELARLVRDRDEAQAIVQLTRLLIQDSPNGPVLAGARVLRESLVALLRGSGAKAPKEYLQEIAEAAPAQRIVELERKLGEAEQKMLMQILDFIHKYSGVLDSLKDNARVTPSKVAIGLGNSLYREFGPKEEKKQ